MSKSLGNYYCLSDLYEKGFTTEEIRYILLSTHYRTKVDFRLDKQHEAKKVIQRIQELKSRLESISSSVSTGFPDETNSFNLALENDLDSPKAMSVFFDWIRKTNIKVDKNKLIAKKAAEGLNFIAYFDSIYGLLPKKESIPQNILDLVAEREEARRNGEWEKSDRLRNLIASEGWLVKDTPSGSKLSVK